MVRWSRLLWLVVGYGATRPLVVTHPARHDRHDGSMHHHRRWTSDLRRGAHLRNHGQVGQFACWLRDSWIRVARRRLHRGGICAWVVRDLRLTARPTSRIQCRRRRAISAWTVRSSSSRAITSAWSSSIGTAPIARPPRTCVDLGLRASGPLQATSATLADTGFPSLAWRINGSRCSSGILARASSSTPLSREVPAMRPRWSPSALPRAASRWTERSGRPVRSAVSAVKRSVSDRCRVSPIWRPTPGDPARVSGWRIS